MAIKEAYDILTRALSKYNFLFIVHFMQYASDAMCRLMFHAHFIWHQFGQLLFSTKHTILRAFDLLDENKLK